MTATETVRSNAGGSCGRIIITLLLDSLLADIRYALRWLRKSPGFTLLAVASLAIGIGFNTALFALVDALLFRPLPVAAPDRLVDVYTSARRLGRPFSTSRSRLPRPARRRTTSSTTWSATRRCSPRWISTTARGWRWARSSPAITSPCSACGAALGRTILPEDDVPARRAWRCCRTATGRASSAGARRGRPHDPHPRHAVHDRRRRPGRLQRDGADARRRRSGFRCPRRSRSSRSVSTTSCRRRPARTVSIGAAIAGCSSGAG